MLVAVGVNSNGYREILGVAEGSRAIPSYPFVGSVPVRDILKVVQETTSLDFLFTSSLPISLTPFPFLRPFSMASLSSCVR